MILCCFSKGRKQNYTGSLFIMLSSEWSKIVAWIKKNFNTVKSYNMIANKSERGYIPVHPAKVAKIVAKTNIIRFDCICSNLPTGDNISRAMWINKTASVLVGAIQPTKDKEICIFNSAFECCLRRHLEHCPDNIHVQMLMAMLSKTKQSNITRAQSGLCYRNKAGLSNICT